VDAYGDKIAAQTLTEAEAKWAALPPTWRSPSRDDGTSGIRLYRIPDGLAWPGEVSPDIETIRWFHRYTIPWPSVHRERRTYPRPGADGGDRSGGVPTDDELPGVPAAWVTGLTNGQADNDLPKADLDN